MCDVCVCVCVQMLLPEGIRRENCKMYEEVEIPPNQPMAVGFEEKPVYISELDEVEDTYTRWCHSCAATTRTREKHLEYTEQNGNLFQINPASVAMGTWRQSAHIHSYVHHMGKQ